MNFHFLNRFDFSFNLENSLKILSTAGKLNLKVCEALIILFKDGNILNAPAINVPNTANKSRLLFK